MTHILPTTISLGRPFGIASTSETVWAAMAFVQISDSATLNSRRIQTIIVRFLLELQKGHKYSGLASLFEIGQCSRESAVYSITSIDGTACAKRKRDADEKVIHNGEFHETRRS